MNNPLFPGSLLLILAMMPGVHAPLADTALPGTSDLMPAGDNGEQIHIRADTVITDIRKESIIYQHNVQLNYQTLKLVADVLEYGLGEQGLLTVTGKPVRATFVRAGTQSIVEILAGRVQMMRPYQKVEFIDEVRITEEGRQASATSILLDIENQLYTGENIQLIISDVGKLKEEIDPKERKKIEADDSGADSGADSDADSGKEQP